MMMKLVLWLLQTDDTPEIHLYIHVNP